MSANTISVVIVGAGPAGLAAAMYLGRFRRDVLLIDSGDSRAQWIPASHNIPGFTNGIAGAALLSQLRAQAERYGARILVGRASAISRRQHGFELEVDGEPLIARFVILATGVKDHFPEIAGAKEAALRSLLRFCPICDGFEATGKRIAVIGDGEHGEKEARFLFQTYSTEVSYLDLSEGDDIRRTALEEEGITVRKVKLAELRIDRDTLSLAAPGRPPDTYDVFYAALGCRPQNQLATRLGAAVDASNALKVSHHQETSVDGLYAAGDVVRGLNQVVVAAAEAAIAATHIHNRLRGAC